MPTTAPITEKSGVAGFLDATKRHLGLFFDYFSQYAKVRVSYRGDFFISLATSFAATIFALIPYGIFNIISLNLYEFGSTYIIEGKFDRVLLRPVSSLFQVLFETFRIESLQEVATGIFCMWWATHHLGLAWTPAKVALLFFFGLCAGIIYISVFLILSTVSFWFEDRI